MARKLSIIIIKIVILVLLTVGDPFPHILNTTQEAHRSGTLSSLTQESSHFICFYQRYFLLLLLSPSSSQQCPEIEEATNLSTFEHWNQDDEGWWWHNRNSNPKGRTRVFTNNNHWPVHNCCMIQLSPSLQLTPVLQPKSTVSRPKITWP